VLDLTAATAPKERHERATETGTKQLN